MSVTQRDLFLTDLLAIAKKDPDVILISPDMGAPALDNWRSELPKQFFATGISEANSINFAAGLSSRGKKVYVYYMACWSARCFEQIRYSCGMAQNPITIIGVGVGLGYAPAGAGHNPTEDMAYMRSICGIEIYSPATNAAVKDLVNYTYNNRKLTYVRLERTYDAALDDFYTNFSISNTQGVHPVRYDKFNDICIITSGYLLSRGLKIAKEIHCNLIDLYRIKPTPVFLSKYLKESNMVITLEEQTLNCGGFSSVIADAIVDNHHQCELIRFGLDEKYILVNGTRDELLDSNGLSVNNIIDEVKIQFNRIY